MNLTDQQRAVVTAPFVPRLVIAGAGSGKTTVMAARVVHAVTEGGFAPSAVLGLTFTNKAAGELRDKVRQVLDRLYAERVVTDDVADDQPTVQTYHSYAAALVRDHALRIGREPDTTLLTEAGRWQLAMSVVARARGPFEHLKWQPRTVAQYLLALDAEMAEHAATPDDVRAADVQIVAEARAAPKQIAKVTDVCQAAWARDELLTLVEAYRERKAELDLLDFGDQVAVAAQIAQSSPDVGRAERERFGVVFLDEYQDTSVAQRELLSALFGDGHPVTAVGDPCQAIYGWRGASIGNLLRFPEHFPRIGGAGYDPDYLLTSFRNDGRVLVAANALSERLRAPDTASRRPHVAVPELEPVADRRETGDVRVAFHQTVVDEAAWVADEIVQATSTGTARREVAVLCRRRADFPLFHDALIVRGVPVEVVGLGGLLEMPEVDDVVAWLEVLVDPTANAALVRILTGPRYRIGPRDLAALGRRATDLARTHQSRDATAGEDAEDDGDPDDADGSRALTEAASSVDPCDVVALTDAIASPGRPDNYSDAAHARILELRAEIDTLRPLVRQPVIEATTAIVTAIGLDVEIETDPDGLGAARMANLAAFLDEAARFEGVGDANDLPAFLDYLAAAREREDGLDVGGVSNRDTVKLLTIHKAKGLEWDVVAVPTLTADTFPSGQRRPRWTRAAQALPTRLRGDRDDLPAEPTYTTAGLDAYADACTADELTEERRLAYVGVTRARRLVIASGHAWNRTRSKPCVPAEFLEEIRDAAVAGAGTVVTWCDEISEHNPVLAVEQRDVAWPLPYAADAHARRLEAAARVTAARADGQLAFGHPLHLEIDAILDEISRERSTHHVVALPRMMSTSQVVRLAADPDAFARALARPMPRKPSSAARRGTLFHSWLEETLKARPLLDTEDLTGAADDAVPSDGDLAALRTAFAASPYAEREAFAVEAPFALQLGGRLVRGRIDAVYRTDDGGFEVVDWKTGESGDALQLALYRLAWAEIAGVDASRVSAVFLHIRSGRIERFDDLPDREALAQLLVGR